VFVVGSDGKLTCIVENSYTEPVINWFKNEVSLTPGEKISLEGSNLWVKSISSRDAGKYACSVGGGDKKVTKSVDVRVIDKNKKIDCEDKSSYNNCKLVVSKGLCYKFAKHCCKTCKQAGFDIRSN
jgi:hypothetical protein